MSEHLTFGNWEDVAIWNIATGCTKISAGCENCYAKKLCLRNQGRTNLKHSSYANGFGLAIHENLLNAPRTFKASRFVWVNSMSDLFHEDFPFIQSAFEVMNACPPNESLMGEMAC